MRWFNLFRKNNIENAVIDNPFRIQLREKHEGQIGYVVSIPRVRILYPRGKNRGDICVADLFSIILWDTIDENYDVRVRIDRGDSGRDKNNVAIDNKIYDAIIEDIRRSDCLVFIVITKDGINETKHKHFYQELIECKKIIENNAKRKDLFVPILLCEPDTIDVHGKRMYSELIENNRLERIEDFVGLSLNKGLKEYIKLFVRIYSAKPIIFQIFRKFELVVKIITVYRGHVFHKISRQLYISS